MLVLVKNNSMTNCAEVHRTRSLSVLQKDVVLLRGSVRLYPRSGVQWVWLTPVMLLGKLVNQGEEWIREVSRGWSHWHRAHEAQLLKCSQSGLPLRWLWRLTHCFFSVYSAHFQDYFWKTGRWKCHRGIEKIWRAAAIRAAFAHVWGSKRLGWLWQHSPGGSEVLLLQSLQGGSVCGASELHFLPCREPLLCFREHSWGSTKGSTFRELRHTENFESHVYTMKRLI